MTRVHRLLRVTLLALLPAVAVLLPAAIPVGDVNPSTHAAGEPRSHGIPESPGVLQDTWDPIPSRYLNPWITIIRGILERWYNVSGSTCNDRLSTVIEGLENSNIWYWAPLPVSTGGGRYDPETNRVFLDSTSYLSDDGSPLVRAHNDSHPLWREVLLRIVNEAYHSGEDGGSEEESDEATDCVGSRVPRTNE